MPPVENSNGSNSSSSNNNNSSNSNNSNGTAGGKKGGKKGSGKGKKGGVKGRHYPHPHPHHRQNKQGDHVEKSIVWMVEVEEETEAKAKTLAGFDAPKRRAPPPKGAVQLPTTSPTTATSTSSSSSSTAGGFAAPVKRRAAPPKGILTPNPTQTPATTAPSLSFSLPSSSEGAGGGEGLGGFNVPRRMRQPPKGSVAPSVPPPATLVAGVVCLAASAAAVATAGYHRGRKDRPLPIFTFERLTDGAPTLTMSTPEGNNNRGDSFVKKKERRRWKGKKKGVGDVDLFPPGEGCLTVPLPPAGTGEGEVILDFDVFTGDWKELRKFTISSSGATTLRDSLSSTSAALKTAYNSTWGIPYEDLRITSEMMGRGAQGSVLKCYHRMTRKALALKKIDLNKYKKDQLLIEAQNKQVERELSMLFAHHDCSYIVKAHNAFYRSNCLLILLEFMDWSLEQVRDTVRRIPQEKLAQITRSKFCTRTRKEQKKRRAATAGEDRRKGVLLGHPPRAVSVGSLEDVLTGSASSPSSTLTGASNPGNGSFASASPGSTNNNNNGTNNSTNGKKAGVSRGTAVPEKVISLIGYQVLCGLSYLHNLEIADNTGVVHKDIKPSNVLINVSGNVKIADFGCCAFVDAAEGGANTPFNGGTQAYMAPERLTGGAYQKSSDIWAFGISLLELASGTYPLPPQAGPWGAFTDRPEYIWPADDYDISDDFRDFVSSCLAQDPKDRPTATQLLSHTFFSGCSESSSEDLQRLAGWVQAVMEFEEEERQRESKLEAKKMSNMLTDHATSRRPGPYQHWADLKLTRMNSPFNPDNLDHFPPLGVETRAELQVNFPHPSNLVKIAGLRCK